MIKTKCVVILLVNVISYLTTCLYLVLQKGKNKNELNHAGFSTQTHLNISESWADDLTYLINLESYKHFEQYTMT